MQLVPLRLLNWMPVLDFKETIKYTVEGYLSDLAGNSAKDDRLKTIKSYTKVAHNRNIDWSQN